MSDKKTPICPITINENPPQRPFIDDWVEESEEDKVFVHTNGAIMMDVSSFFHLPERNPGLDTFSLESKRVYNSDMVRTHITRYLNYYEKFYDFNHELPAIYASLKYLIDYEPSYGKEALFYDLSRYFINRQSPIVIKLMRMNEDNYNLELTYRNKKNPVLQYRNRHAKLLMLISVLINMIIIPACHFMKVRQIKKTNEFLLEIFDRLLLIDPDIDIYSKLIETATSSVHQSEAKNRDIFEKQDIRGLNATIHAQNSVANILINIIPKYKYSENIINMNFRSILNHTGLIEAPLDSNIEMQTLLIAGTGCMLLHYNMVIISLDGNGECGNECEGYKKIRDRLNQQLSLICALSEGEREIPSV